jgi:hypothetical protein
VAVSVQGPTISSPKARVGVVVLTNQAGDVGDIARHLLRPDFPLAKPANTKHIEIALDSKVLDSYVGRYEAKGEGIFTIARENGFPDDRIVRRRGSRAGRAVAIFTKAGRPRDCDPRILPS